MKNTKEYNRAKYLLKRYTPNRITTGEEVSKEYKAKIDKANHDRHKKDLINGILGEVNSPLTVKDEVHSICAEVDDLKILCRTCKIEQIVAVIVLYVQRLHNNQLKEERTRLWNHYDLSWKLYARIVARLLRETRKSRPV